MPKDFISVVYQSQRSPQTGTGLPIAVTWPVILLLSLGLWTMIWLAISSLLSH